MDISLNLRHLYAALEIQDCGSLSKAAERAHLSQSALTQAIASLEEKVGAALFLRHATGVEATPAGEAFLARVRRAQRYLKAIESIAPSGGDPRVRRLARLLTHKQLRSLVAVVDAGNYTRAAATLSVSQPTVHRAVRELESLCQLTLFRRAPAGVEPTWQARQMAHQASLFFAEVQQGLTEVMERQDRHTGSISVGALPYSRSRLVPQAVSRLLAEMPDTSVRIIDGPYEEQLHGLLRGQIDVIVGALREPAPSPDTVQELLLSDPLNVVVRSGHWLLEKTRLSANQLQKLEWIAPRKQTPARALFTEFFEREGLTPPERVIECSSLVAIRGLLLESDRAALLPAQQVALDVERGILAVSPFPLKGTTRDIGLTLRRDWQPTKAQSRFLTLLRQLALS
ncbi:MAG: LysR family transcriptional regulator [Haliea sp.]|uniref:LysR family transcriptional regulator n=1 Tax=Haliea sp. TaxID=1932666 RepID=UPI000C4C9533|nr:LysR family transcriptional regulator [Haliea sp.]MBM68106.1 LysR family transcriptional regulator [Haliea sp.]|tara:strand:+ start:15863 stop:17059 length:1197 start_codon:yes stop_codon:yes gene_type:complete